MSLNSLFKKQDDAQGLRWSWILTLGSVVVLGVVCYLLWDNGATSRQASADPFVLHPRQIRLRGFESHVVRNPEDVETWAEYAAFLSQLPTAKQTRFREAIEAWQKCTELESGNAEYWYRLSTTCRAAGRTEQALHSARQAYRITPENPRYLALLASLKMDVGDTLAANQLLDSATQDSPSCWQLVLLRIRGMIQDATDSERVVSAVQQAKRDFPKERELDGVMAYVKWAHGDEQAARDQITLIANDHSACSLEYSRFLAVLSRSMGLDDVAQKVCHSTEGTQRDPFLSLLAARRSWELGNARDVVETLQSRPLSLCADPEACLLMALALRSLLERSRLKSLLHDFSRQRGCQVTDAWFRLIDLLVAKKQASVREVAKATNEVRKHSKNSPMLCYIHGSSFFLLGEYDVACRIASEAARQSPRWELPRHLLVNASIMMGDPHQALEIARKNATAFPDQLDAQISYALTQAILLPKANRAQAERLLRWTSSVELSEHDPRVPEIALVRWLAHTRLGNEEEASSVQAEFLSPWQTLSTDELIRVLTLRRQKNIATGAMGLESDSEPLVELDVREPDDATTERSPNEDATGAVDGEVGWRIEKARDLLTTNLDESNAASAALVLRPVVKAMPHHVDARLLMGVAMLRLHDHSAANDHFLAVVSHDPASLSQVLRLSLGCRRAGHWADAHQLADFWVLAGRTAATKAHAQQTQVTGDKNLSIDEPAGAVKHLQALAEFADQSSDRKLAVAAYRRWLRFEPENAVACNNLAYLIYHQKDSLEEAFELSTIALGKQPNQVEFQRTMQTIQKHMEESENSPSNNGSRMIRFNEVETKQ